MPSRSRPISSRADGTAYHWTWTAKFDGKDAPITGTTPFGPGTVAALTRVDAHTAKIVGKRNGEVILTQTIVTSADGKTRTLTTQGQGRQGSGGRNDVGLRQAVASGVR